MSGGAARVLLALIAHDPVGVEVAIKVAVSSKPIADPEGAAAAR